jgi:digeranylgeranylglycerophospholipid reductase
LLDVAVIGGGPIGSRVAYTLAEKGYQVAVLEKRAAIGEKVCCTGIISQECINRYAIPPDVIYRSLNSAKIFSPSGNMIRVYRPETQACIVNRPALDCCMADRARSKGVRYYLECRAENIDYFPDRVLITTQRPDGKGQFEAKAVVLATGFNAPLVKKCGFSSPQYFTTGVQAEVDIPANTEVQVWFNQDIAPGFFAWLAPTAPGKALAGLMTRQTPGRQLRNWLQQLEKQGQIHPGKHLLRYSGIPLKFTGRTSGKRVLIAGDAAGQVKPTSGGGIYFGLICADIAADTLHNAITTDNFSARALAAYDRAWRQILAKELQKEYLARRIYEKLSNQQIDLIISALKSSGIIESLLKEPELSFDWHGGLLLKALKSAIGTGAHRLFKVGLGRTQK